MEFSGDIDCALSSKVAPRLWTQGSVADVGAAVLVALGRGPRAAALHAAGWQLVVQVGGACACPASCSCTRATRGTPLSTTSRAIILLLLLRAVRKSTGVATGWSRLAHQQLG